MGTAQPCAANLIVTDPGQTQPCQTYNFGVIIMNVTASQGFLQFNFMEASYLSAPKSLNMLEQLTGGKTGNGTRWRVIDRPYITIFNPDDYSQIFTATTTANTTVSRTEQPDSTGARSWLSFQNLNISGGTANFFEGKKYLFTWKDITAPPA